MYFAYSDASPACTLNSAEMTVCAYGKQYVSSLLKLKSLVHFSGLASSDAAEPAYARALLPLRDGQAYLGSSSGTLCILDLQQSMSAIRIAIEDRIFRYSHQTGPSVKPSRALLRSTQADGAEPEQKAKSGQLSPSLQRPVTSSNKKGRHLPRRKVDVDQAKHKVGNEVPIFANTHLRLN